ncbi:hypothetical protein BDV41DRAFT_270914 [Aspergillus transmontanensis]|uniref:Secreted protein n=1 Tax=Aspergillus transmontanensis TaxID=1034304 RepID=A0A5N6VZ15_9EURO|nr:hypothetical protein BDV41DRAFT_270914 [Aspergillus transmontanensis]
MDKQTTGWWNLLAFSLRLAFLLSLASDQLTLAGCSLDGLALWAPLRLVPVVPVDRAFVGACLSPPLSLFPRPTLPFPFFLFLFFFPWLSFHSYHPSIHSCSFLPRHVLSILSRCRLHSFSCSPRCPFVLLYQPGPLCPATPSLQTARPT